MKSYFPLKEFINKEHENEYLNDYMAIKKYIEYNDFESDYIQLVVELSKTKLEKIESILNRCQSNLPYPIDNLYKEYLYEDAKLLDQLVRVYILRKENFEHDVKLFGNLYKDACERIPKLNCPKIYYRECLEALEKIGIYFKDRHPNNIK